MNTESSQPPLFYTLAGAWWRLGEWCGFHDGYLCYWLRFINVILVPLLVWMGYFAAKSAFPEFPLIRLGVPALLAVMPQTVFYSVTNDILSPITFGLVFICIIRWFQSENPGLGLGFALGGALAATFLTKLCNLPLIGTAGVFLLWDAVHRAKSGNLRPAIPPAMCLAFSAIVPMVCWAIWCRHNFGDFTGSETKIKLLGWTHKPVNAWVPHPLFTPRGAWIFIRDLLASFWRGEFLWHRQPLASHFIDLLYVLGSLGLMMTALPNCFRRASPLSRNEGRNLLFSFSTLPVSMAFFAFLSLIYDFHFCFYPSHDHPYFTSGRLMLGAAIPILVVLLYGLDRVLEAFKGTWARWFVLAGMMALMLAGEIVVDWPVFYSQYNWFHLQG